MTFCVQCHLEQYCKRLVTPVFTDDEIKRPFFLADMKTFLVVYSFEHHLLPSEWHDHMVGLYRDYRGWIKGEGGQEIFLDLSVFELLHIREWFRDYIQIVPNGVETRLRGESKERVRILATIIRTHYPVEASLWGIRPANDNEFPISPSSSSAAD